ncbi:MAG: peptidase M23 [Proteobacteria bacterium]|nr:MAG: peptidase M23 [Pseudomonadota bacterium]
MRFFILFCLLFSFLEAKIEAFNGNTIVLEFNKSQISHPKIGKKKLNILDHPRDKTKNILLIPIKYRQKKDLTLNYIYKNKPASIILHIKQKNYKKEKLKVSSSKVKPPKNLLSRISKEYKEAMKIYGTFTKKRYWNKPFINPLNSKITSDYGNARIFNKKLKSFHGGTDFRAKMGTAIRSTNDGVVVLAKERYYAGGSVIIDHGEGLYSCYYHLSKMPLKVGTHVKQGDIIGLSGKSGRVTGPHLHFTIMLGGVSVDSQDFIEKVNGLFE